MTASHAEGRSRPRILLVLALAASMLAAAVGTAAASDDFDDVPDDHPFHDEIGWMVDEAITTGFPDGTFKPGRDVTRQAYMAFLYRMAGHPTWAGCDPTAFSDVDDTHPFCEEITWGAEMGVTTGYPDGTFKPGRDVTRQAAAAFQYRAVGEPNHDHDASFSDVGADHTFHTEIAWADGEDIANGYDDGTYKPARDVTRQAAAAFLFRQDSAGYLVLPGGGPTNQQFEVAPASATHLPAEGSRDHAVDPADASTVTIELALCENVDVTGGTATFTVDDSGADDVAEFGNTTSGVAGVEANGTPQTDTGTGESITVNGGLLTFTVNGNGPECVVAVIFHDADDDGLDVTTGGEPTEDFGIAGATTFQDATSLTAAPETALNAFGTDHTVTATLLGSDVDGDGEDDPLPLVDDTVDVRVVRYEDEPTREFDCSVGGGSFAGTTVENLTGFIDENGEATVTYTGPNDPDTGTDGSQRFDCIVAEWEGSGAYDGQGPFQAVASKDWSDAEPTITSLDLQQDQDINLVDTDHTVTATVTDQYDDPVAGVDVRFEIDRDTGSFVAHTRTTNSDGVATFTYNGPSIEAEDTITAIAEDDQGEDTDATDSVTKTWSEGIVENLDTGEVYASLTDAEAAAAADETLRAEGDFTEQVTIDVAGLTLQSDGATLHEIDGITAGEAYLTVASDGVTVQGLATIDEDDDVFPTHIRVTGDDATIADGQLTRQFPDAASAAANSGNPLVHAPGDGNTISGNTLDGGPIGAELSGDGGSVAITGNSVTTVLDEGIWVTTTSGSFVTIEGNSVTDHDLDEDGSAEARLSNRPASVNGELTPTAEDAANQVLDDNAGIDTVEVAGTVYP